jgi:hypothetical protein
LHPASGPSPAAQTTAFQRMAPPTLSA